jgi:hypothetical protein
MTKTRNFICTTISEAGSVRINVKGTIWDYSHPGVPIDDPSLPMGQHQISNRYGDGLTKVVITPDIETVNKNGRLWIGYRASGIVQIFSFDCPGLPNEMPFLEIICSDIDIWSGDQSVVFHCHRDYVYRRP